MTETTAKQTADREAIGQVIARVPLQEHLRDMEQKGLIKRGKQPLPADFWDLPRPADPQAAVRSTVLREREVGW